MKLSKKAGETSVILQVFIQDSAQSDGRGLAGLVFNSAGLTAYFHREGDTAATQITLVTMTLGAFTSGGFKEIDAVNMKGWYQFCPPDEAVAAGAKSVGIHLAGAANMAPLPIELQLVGYDPNDGVRLGLTALPNAAAEAAGGLYTRGSGAGQINQTANGQIDANVAAIVNGVISAAKFAAGAFDAVWTVTTRTLTSFGSLVADTASAVAAALASSLSAIFAAAGTAATEATNAAADTAAMRPIIETSLDVVLSSRAASGVQDANLVQIQGATGPVDRLKRVTDSEVLGEVDAGSSQTSIVTASLDPAATVADQFKGRVVLFDRATTTPELRGQGTRITANTSGGVLTVEALTAAPASGDTFAIV